MITKLCSTPIIPPFVTITSTSAPNEYPMCNPVNLDMICGWICKLIISCLFWCYQTTDISWWGLWQEKQTTVVVAGWVEFQSVTTLCGHCVDTVWTLCRYCVDIVWILCGYCVDTVWILCGPCVDTVWSLGMQCVDVVWTLYGHCVDNVWTLFDCILSNKSFS